MFEVQINMSQKKQLKEDNWEKILTRNNSIFMDYMKLFGASQVYTELGYDYRVKNFKIVNGVNYTNQEYSSYIENLKKEYNKDKKILNNIFNSGVSNIKKLKKTWNNIKNIDLAHASNSELKSSFNNYMDSLYKLMAYLFTPLFAEKILTEEISNIIKKYSNESDINRTLPILTAPKRLSEIQKETIEFFEMKQKLCENKTINNKLITTHISKWGWLGDHNYIGSFWTVKDINLRIEESKNKNSSKEVSNIKQDLENAKKEYQTVTKKWNLTQEEKDLIELAKEFVYFRTFRFDMLFYSEFLVQNLLLEIAKRLKLDYRNLMFLSPSEINDLITNNKDNNFKEEILRRKESYAIILKNCKLEIYSGKETEKFIESKKENSLTKELKGNIAFLGIVKGIVRVITDRKQFKNFNPGEILVTPMTTPDFVPLMRSCSAIVTDEGGITCHAAIVSREMKKPCIIGTKIATQILKDGDLVEVNAKKGVVRIL